MAEVASFEPNNYGPQLVQAYAEMWQVKRAVDKVPDVDEILDDAIETQAITLDNVGELSDKVYSDISWKALRTRLIETKVPAAENKLNKILRTVHGRLVTVQALDDKHPISEEKVKGSHSIYDQINTVLDATGLLKDPQPRMIYDYTMRLEAPKRALHAKRFYSFDVINIFTGLPLVELSIED